MTTANETHLRGIFPTPRLLSMLTALPRKWPVSLTLSPARFTAGIKGFGFTLEAEIIPDSATFSRGRFETAVTLSGKALDDLAETIGECPTGAVMLQYVSSGARGVGGILVSAAPAVLEELSGGLYLNGERQ